MEKRIVKSDEQLMQLTAKDAQVQSNENAIPLLEVLRNINNASQNGVNQIILTNTFMTFDLQQEILKRGFTLKQTTAYLGESVFIISW